MITQVEDYMGEGIVRSTIGLDDRRQAQNPGDKRVLVIKQPSQNADGVLSLLYIHWYSRSPLYRAADLAITD